MYEKVRSAIESECPEVVVLENEQHPSIKPILSQKPDRMPNPNLKFPKTGSFEVYFRGKVIFSKLKTGMWPNPLTVANSARNLLDNHTDVKDFNAASSKTLQKKPEVPKFSKNRSESNFSNTKRELMPGSSRQGKRDLKGLNYAVSQKNFLRDDEEIKVQEKVPNSPPVLQKKQSKDEIDNQTSGNGNVKIVNDRSPERIEKKDSIKKQGSIKEFNVKFNEVVTDTHKTSEKGDDKKTSETNNSNLRKDAKQETSKELPTPKVVGEEADIHTKPQINSADLTEKKHEEVKKYEQIEKKEEPKNVSLVQASQDDYTNNFSSKVEEKSETTNKEKEPSSSDDKSSKSDESSDKFIVPENVKFETFKVPLTVNEGKSSKITFKNNKASTKIYKIGVKNKKLIKVEQDEYEIPSEVPQRIKLEFLPQSSVGTYKGYITISSDGDMINCYEIVGDVQ